MKAVRKKRLGFILLLVTAVSIATSLLLYALRENINLFYSPSQVVLGQVPIKHDIRLGGLVAVGSVTRGKNLLVKFVLTDNHHVVKVQYFGVLPDLFREGQGIVTEGRLAPSGMFVARRVLAKHDNNYMPVGVKQALELATKEHR